MICLGIDVAKSSHVSAALTSEGEVALEPFSLANSASGFAMPKEKLKLFSDIPLLIGLESTAHYGENLICFLCGNGYRVAMLNPFRPRPFGNPLFAKPRRTEWMRSCLRSP